MLMRKFTLFLFAVLLSATASMAQQGRKTVAGLHRSSTVPLHTDAPLKQQARHQQPQQAPVGGPYRLIGDQPAGDHYFYARSGDAYLYYFNLYQQQLNGSVSEMVFDALGNVYLKNIITQYNRLSAEKYDSWLEGTVDEGTVSFEFPQPVMTIQGTTYYATLMTLDQQQGTYVKAASQTLTLDYDALTGDVTTPAGTPFATGQTVVGLTNLDGAWTGFADWNVELHRVNDATTSAPEGIAPKDYAIAAEGFEGTLGSAVFHDGDIYVKGIYPALPDAWVKGSVSGNQATFKSGQFIGADTANDRFVYLFGATATQDGEGNTVYTLSDQDIIFSYDAATGTLTDGSLFVANNGKWKANPAVVYSQATMKPFTEVAATPATPQGLTLYEGGFADYNRGYGWGHMEFTLPSADADGNYIMPEKLSYALFVRVNGEERQLKLYSHQYQQQAEPVVDEIPYNYSDNWDIYVRGSLRSVYYFVVGPEAYGVQAIYRGGGEEHRSPISWVSATGMGADVQPDAATPAYPDIDPADTGSEIRFTPTINGGTRDYFGNWKAKTYDVAIKVADEHLTGTYIEEITFPLMRAQNVSNVKVWLSSQLRVENDQNVPDLVSVDIEKPKAANLTVKLDKPYLIPAEGVYVGYSLTINENSYNGNGPIRVVKQPKPTGFYIHATDEILKWMDISEATGMAAIVEMKLGGSKVKQNAVTPLNGEPLFASVDTDLKTNVTLVNHGSQGIKSLDLEYTINGQTTEEHIDLKSSVNATYGLQTTQTLTLAPISERGTYDLTLRVVKVNGEPNEDADATATTRIIIINGEPKHRPLLEEFTGTWCGWCPRGFVALEKLAQLYPDDYVCVAYHNADPMEVTQQLPVSSFPNALLDRGMQLDPYYGSTYGNGNKNFAILDDLKWRASQFGVADIDLTAKLSDDEQTVDVNTNVVFPFDNDQAHYALEYILVADGLTGEGSQWEQTNNFSGQNYGSDMRDFQYSGSSVPGLEYNDVVVMLSQTGGIEGSIPEQVTAGTPVSHTYSFNLSEALNTSGKPVIQDVNKLRVVALLISKDEDGIVANANKAAVSTPLAVGTVSEQRRPVSIKIFDLSGRQQTELQPGLNIISYTFADGTTRTRKVIK